MRVSDLLPFMTHARLVHSRYEEGPASALTYPQGLEGPMGMGSQDAVGYFSTKIIRVYVPTDTLTFRVPDLTNREYRLLSVLPPETVLTLQVQEIDYQSIISNLTFDDQGGAYFDFIGVTDYEPLPGPLSEAVHEAALGNYGGLEAIIRGASPQAIGPSAPVLGAVREEVLPRGISQMLVKEPFDAIERYLTNYIQSRTDSARVPVLIGYTAVAKSALVKSVVKKLGLRMVDFRCAFMDKQNIEGFRKKVIGPMGEVYSTTAPPEKIIQCTDEFLSYCEATSRELETVLPTLADDKQKAATQAIIDNLKHMAIPPVLFFDEITRAPAAVQNAFVQILSGKSFRGMPISRAKIVAATNYPTGLSERFKEAFLTMEAKDGGVFERFESLQIEPKAVQGRWMRYIEGPGAFDPVLLEFLKEDPDYRTYNIEVVVATVDTSMGVVGEKSENDSTPQMKVAKNPLVTDETDVGIIPFPNFRTWEFVNDHIRAVRAKKTVFNKDLVYGLIGKNDISDELIKFVKSKIPEANKKANSKDFLGNALHSAFFSGTPILMMGMSSIGKTSRVKAMAKKYGAHVIEINLAQKDRVDVQGAPCTIPISDALGFGARKEDIPLEVQAVMETKRKTHLASFTDFTRNAPDHHLSLEIEKAKGAGEKVILFFDELNRADGQTMSAVLEAVSDQRFGGVSFPWKCIDPIHRWEGPRDDVVSGACPLGHPAEPQVMIVAACNYGENYEGANKLDPAISGRFAMIQKLTFDDVDREIILDFMKNSTEPVYPEIVIKFIEERDLEELKKMLSMVEDRTLVEAAPSLRAWSDMAKAVTQIKDIAMQGRVMGKVWEEDMGKSSYTLEEAEKKLHSIPANWAGYLSDKPFSLQGVVGKEWTTKQLVANIQDTIAAGKSGIYPPTEMPGILDDINFSMAHLRGINEDVTSYRNVEFKTKLGDLYAKDFGDFYNLLTGDRKLSIQDVVSPELALEYAKYLRDKFPNPDDYKNALRKYWEEYYTHFGSGAPKLMYQAVFRAVKELSPNVDVFLEILNCYTVSVFPGVKSFLDLALDAKLTVEVLGTIGVGQQFTDQDIEAYYAPGRKP